MADETPTPTQAESDEMVLAATGGSVPLGQPSPREGEDLTPTLTQAQNDVAVLIAAGPAPETLPPFVIDMPYVDGTGTVGATLTCTMGNWTGEPTEYAYQWTSDEANVGSDAASYVIAAGDAGHSMACVVTATNDNGSTAAPPSNAVMVDASAAATKEGASAGRHGR